ncbi:MAG: hypothetical protein CMF39_01765 [Legionellaceae bacterium]|nr:hypothetical protein [Legionellaceae bacterium]
MKKIIPAALALTALSTTALAAPSLAGSNHNTSAYYWPAKTWYVEATGGTNFAYLGVLSSTSTNTDTGMQGWGWSGAVGYNIRDFFALEAGFMQNYVNVEAENDTSSGDKAYISGHTNIPYFTTRFTVPVANQFAFIGKLGVMYASASGSGKDSEGTQQNAKSPSLLLPYVGIGAGYSFTPNVQLVAQYQGAVYGIVGAGLLSLGIDWRF